MIKCFYRRFRIFQSFIKFIRIDMRFIKCRKVKFVAYQDGRSVFLLISHLVSDRGQIETRFLSLEIIC